MSSRAVAAKGVSQGRRKVVPRAARGCTDVDKYLYKPRTDDEYFEALARGGQKSEVRVDVVNLATHHRLTTRQTITNISRLQLHHHRYSHRPALPSAAPN